MFRRILVTGAAGFIGARLVRQLAETRHVVAVDRSSERLSSLARALPTISTAVLDVANSEEVAALWRAEGLEAAVHLAWYADPRDYLTSHSNLGSLSATTSFIDTILKIGCRKIVIGGSCAEYGPKTGLLVETDLARPATLYGAAKLAAFEIAKILSDEVGADLAWARIFHLHGPGEDRRRLIPWVASQLAAGKPVELTDGTQMRDHLHVEDVAGALIPLLAPGAQGIFNVCSGVPVSLRSVLEIVGELLERPDLLRFGERERRPGEPPFLAGDPTKLRETGWSPRFSLRDGLIDTLRDRCFN